LLPEHLLAIVAGMNGEIILKPGVIPTIAPPWPFKDAPASELRNRHPHDTDLAILTLEEVLIIT